MFNNTSGILYLKITLKTMVDFLTSVIEREVPVDGK